MLHISLSHLYDMSLSHYYSGPIEAGVCRARGYNQTQEGVHDETAAERREENVGTPG